MVYLARVLPQEEVGLFYLALSFVSVISIFADLGISMTAPRYIPYFMEKGKPGEVRRLVKYTAFVGICSTLLFSLAVLFLSGNIADSFKNPRLQQPLAIMAFYIIIVELYNIAQSLFVGFKKIKENAMMANFQSLLKLVFAVVFIGFLGNSAVINSYAFLASFLVPALFAAPFLLKFVSSVEHGGVEGSNRQFLAEILPFGFMLGIVSTFNFVLAYADRLMVGYFITGAEGERAVAIYSVATGLAGLLSVAAVAIATTFLPVVSSIHGRDEKDHASLGKNVGVTTKWMLFFTVPFLLLFLVFPEQILEVIYGAQYSSGANVLALTALGSLILLITHMHRVVLAGMRLVGIELKMAAVTVLINIALNLYLIPVYGIDGAALATLISFVAMTLMTNAFSIQSFSFGFPPDILKHLATIAVAVGIMLVLKEPILAASVGILSIKELFASTDFVSVILSKFVRLAFIAVLGCIGMAFYVAGLMFFKLFRQYDIDVMKEFLKRVGVSDRFICPIESILLWGTSRGE